MAGAGDMRLYYDDTIILITQINTRKSAKENSIAGRKVESLRALSTRVPASQAVRGAQLEKRSTMEK